MTTDTSRGQEAVEVDGSIDCSISKVVEMQEVQPEAPLSRDSEAASGERAILMALRYEKMGTLFMGFLLG
jgi:hypothetical protein